VLVYSQEGEGAASQRWVHGVRQYSSEEGKLAGATLSKGGRASLSPKTRGPAYFMNLIRVKPLFFREGTVIGRRREGSRTASKPPGERGPRTGNFSRPASVEKRKNCASQDKERQKSGCKVKSGSSA